jgi:hypothetical protein
MTSSRNVRASRFILAAVFVAAGLAASAEPAVAQTDAPAARESLGDCWRQYGLFLIFHPTKCSLFAQAEAAPMPAAPEVAPASPSPPPTPPPPPPRPPLAPPPAPR